MFERTLDSSWDEHSRRGLTTLTSFGIQIFAVSVLLLVPLFRPQGLPPFHQLSTPISLGQPATEPSTVRVRTGGGSAANSTPADITFRQPSRIPRGIQLDGDDPAPQIGPTGSAIPGVKIGDPNGVRNLFESGSRPILPIVHPPIPVAPLRVSHMSEGNLIRKVQPVYPGPARAARIQGAVVMQAVINKEGGIEKLRLLSGHPMLVRAAIEAVSQWRYRPYILNNEPVEVETQITVNFSLAGN
jgi:periplasmic protein TonB